LGTQQILLIVLSVIIVGVAVAVGIQMFNTQAMNSNRQAVIGELQTYGTQIMLYHRTPASQGGGGNSKLAYASVNVEAFLGWDIAVHSSDTGVFTFWDTEAGEITIIGVGTETGNDGTNKVKATLTVTMANATPLNIVINN